MRKPKIYLDTSVVSYLYQLDAPDKMNDTLALWEEIKQGLYDVCVSETAFIEISRCNETKKNILAEYLSQIHYERIAITPETALLADEIIHQGILSQKSYDDCIHIATAIISHCDIVVSWNFKHMVNVKTINGVRAVSLLNGYRTIDIYSPTVLLKGDDF